MPEPLMVAVVLNEMFGSEPKWSFKVYLHPSYFLRHSGQPLVSNASLITISVHNFLLYFYISVKTSVFTLKTLITLEISSRCGYLTYLMLEFYFIWAHVWYKPYSYFVYLLLYLNPPENIYKYYRLRNKKCYCLDSV